MKHIYIFNLVSKSAIYGIGTYVNQLLQMKNYGFKMHFVLLNADVTEVVIETIEGIETIFLPNPVLVPINKISHGDYQINAVRILRRYIDIEADNIFHLNNLDMLYLAKAAKKYFKGKIILTIHYSQSLFDLGGNIANFNKIVQSPEVEDDPPLFTAIRSEIKNVSQMTDLYVDKVISIAQHSYKQNNEI